MEVPQEDRLKAFLERNRNRLSQRTDTSPLENLQNNILPPSLTKSSNIEPSKSFSQMLENQSTQDLRQNHRNQDASKKNFKEGPDGSSNYFSATSTDSFAPQLTRGQNTGDTPRRMPYLDPYLTQDSRSLKTNMLSTNTQSTDKLRKSDSRQIMSTSPARVNTWENAFVTKSKSRIEDYLKGQKVAKTKMRIRERVRSLSTEPGMKPLRASFVLNNSSTRSKAYDSNSRSSIGFENSEPPNSTKSFDRLSKSQLFDSFAKQQKKPISQKKNKLGKSVTGESREYCFEETEDALRKNKNKSKSKVHSRSNSKPPISPIKNNKEKPNKDKSVDEKRNKEKSRNRDKSGKKVDQKLFPESSKKLVVLDNSLDNGHKFKKEIKNLIGIIKKEREQISSELDAMSKELKKYKSAYKALKKEVNATKKGNAALNQDQDKSPASDINHSNFQAYKTKTEEKFAKKDYDDGMNYPLTINELTQYIENSVPVQNEENIEDLLAKIDTVHTDVETLLNKNEYEPKSPQKRPQDLKSFELRRTPVNWYIIKEMGLPPSLFFQDTYPEEPIECKPNLIDLLAAQREVIYFLVKKLEIEEQQRLKTEEQASKMISSMEKTVKQLEGKSIGLRLNRTGLSAQKGESMIQTMNRSRNEGQLEE